jgi:hypothetical protein
MKIQNSPIRPPKTLQAHHIRHIISGTLVFLLGVAANEAITYARHHWPRKVRWTAVEVQHDYVRDECASGDGTYRRRHGRLESEKRVIQLNAQFALHFGEGPNCDLQIFA